MGFRTRKTVEHFLWNKRVFLAASDFYISRGDADRQTPLKDLQAQLPSAKCLRYCHHGIDIASVQLIHVMNAYLSISKLDGRKLSDQAK